MMIKKIEKSCLLLVKSRHKRVSVRLLRNFFIVLLVFNFSYCFSESKVEGDYLITEDYDRGFRGVVVALNRAVVSSEISAKIIMFPFRAGAQFKKGDSLVLFDCTLYQAQKEKVKAEYDLVKIKLDNDLKLQSFNSIGNLEIAISEAKVKKTELELKIAQLNVNRCHIKAPYDGRVVKLFKNEYESVSQQQELFEIVGADELEVELIFPSQQLPELKTGRNFKITIDETGRSISATIITAGAVIDPVSQTVSVRARFVGKHDFLLPGMSGTARF